VEHPVNNSSRNVQIVGGIIFALYALGYLFPDTFWAMHYPALLGSGTNLVVFVVAGALLFFGPNFFGSSPAFDRFPSTKRNGFVLAVGLSLAMGLLFYSFPIFFDVYGDSLWVKGEGVVLTTISDKHWAEFISLDYFNLKIGTSSAFGTGAVVAYLFGLTLDEAFGLIDLIAGMLFVLIWVRFVLRWVQNGTLRWALIVLGLTAPLALHFCQHYEVYATTYVLMLLYISIVLEFVATRKSLWLWVQIPMLLLCQKYHVTTALLYPAFGMCLLLQFGNPKWKVLQLKGALTYLFIPMLLLGVFVYVFVTESVFGNRAYDAETWDTVFFLPISAAEGPPYDRYNLFSWNHIFDYFNMFFLWSSVALFIGGAILVKWRNRIDWNRPEVVILTLTFLIYVAFFFVFNPLLGMTADWDLMSLPALILLPLIVVLSKQLQRDEFPKQVVAGSFAFGLLCLCGIFVNADQESLSAHYESVGRRDFKTYWRGTSTTIVSGINMGAANEIEERYTRIIEDLAPYAVENDIEYSEILTQAGELQLNGKRNPAGASVYFEQALAYCPDLQRAHYNLVVSYFKQQRMDEAFVHLQGLIQKQYPDQPKAYKIAIHTAIEAAQYETAFQFCNDYLAIFPDDGFIRRVTDSLAMSKQLDRVKFMFRQE
jgi:hypothetical protein